MPFGNPYAQNPLSQYINRGVPQGGMEALIPLLLAARGQGMPGGGVPQAPWTSRGTMGPPGGLTTALPNDTGTPVQPGGGVMQAPWNQRGTMGGGQLLPFLQALWASSQPKVLPSQPSGGF